LTEIERVERSVFAVELGYLKANEEDVRKKPFEKLPIKSRHTNLANFRDVNETL
jgi:hypothetical protein